MKRILFLGGSISQVSVLKRAREMGHEVLLCDYSAECPGREYADAFYAVSTTDTKTVLALAEKARIDAVVALASDPAASTAAEVAEVLGLPGNTVQSVDILSHKNLYRSFLRDHGFSTPEFNEEGMSMPVVVKPTDLSGSKGVTVVNDESDLEAALFLAKQFSRSGEIIVEKFVERKGYQVAGDGFVAGGKLVFRCFADEHFDEGGIVPIGESFPSSLSEEMQERIHNEVQSLIDAVGFENGALNFDIMIDKNDSIFLMEIGPRAGGCLIPEVIKLATGFDEAAYVIKAALDEDLSELKQLPVKGFYASYMVHSHADGKYQGLWISPDIEKNIIEKEMFVQLGETVRSYAHSGCTCGTMLLRFGSQEEMLRKMDHMDCYVRVMT